MIKIIKSIFTILVVVYFVLGWSNFDNFKSEIFAQELNEKESKELEKMETGTIKLYSLKKSKWEYSKESDISIFDNYDTVFTPGLGFIIVDKGKMKEYSSINKEWEQINITLPDNYENVFGVWGIGVVSNGEVKAYSKENNNWDEISFTLPKNYNSAFGILFENKNKPLGIELAIAVLIQNKINFYTLNSKNNKWNEIKGTEFLISGSYQKVFSVGSYIGVLNNRKIKFFSKEKKWKEIKGLDFIIPENYKDVFGSVMGEPTLCVVTGK